MLVEPKKLKEGFFLITEIAAAHPADHAVIEVADWHRIGFRHRFGVRLESGTA
jgi:hypothetical protein